MGRMLYVLTPCKIRLVRIFKYRRELWSKFLFLADKEEKAADGNGDYDKYDIYMISRISQLTSV